ncbi:MAG: type II secretion system F family protein [Candidatus Nomurabacteria bacterium]|jgi:type IV pilus assembly protein PilC|nr:type II secretion system F family protein [Candidatus Nomurabacteria bacterium]
MKRFDYRARNEKGEIVKGSVQAEDEYEAGKLIVGSGLVPQAITEANTGGFLNNLLNRITTKDKIIFTRQFATLIGAGLPLAQSLQTIAEQTISKPMRGVVEDILATVEGGKPLADAMEKFPKVFNNVYVALIRSGEYSGTLDKSLSRLANQLEKDAEMMSKIRGAMVYPAIVLVVIVLVMGFMLFTVIPQVELLYNDLHQSLPFITEIMVGVSRFIIKWWWAIGGVIIGLIFLFIQFLRTKTGTRFKHSFALNVPVFKGLFRRLYMARFSRTSQILLESGVPILDMLDISSDAVNNVIIAESIDKAAELVKGGKALSESLKIQDYVLPIVTQMIGIGEQSGKMDEMFGKAAEVLEREVDEEIRTISTMIEPILMVFLAIVAGGMLFAVLFPIYALVNMV